MSLQPPERRFVTEANVNDLVTEQVTDVLTDASFEVESTETLPPGSSAEVELLKDGPFDQRFRFRIPKGDKGDRGLTPRGAWAAGTAYAVDDVVTRNGSMYRRKVAGTTATAPESDTTNWETWVAKGDKGDIGLDRFLIYTSGAYPTRPDNNPVVFVGSVNPDTAGPGGTSLMLAGDTWINNEDPPAQPTGVIYGTGSPEGAISAPVGQEYVDLAKTNGARKWIKDFGTGNTGWTVTVGDTGWRDVSSLLNAGLTPSSILGVAQIRRINNVVYARWKLDVAASGITVIIQGVPAGFRAAGYDHSVMMTRNLSGQGASALTSWQAGLTANGLATWQTGATQPLPNPGTVAWSPTHVTSDPWPTALPGTAA